MTPLLLIETPYVVNSLTINLQKYIHKTKTLNKTNLMSKYLKIKDFLNFSLTRQLNMCSNHYFRITDERINPTYLYWHIVQDFQMDKVRRLLDRDFVTRRNLANHLIYISGEKMSLMSIGVFVKKGGKANLKIGKYPRNFGKVTLLSTEYFYQVKTTEKNT